MLFARTDHTNCSAIQDILDEFCAISRQTITESKSRLYFSPNVDRDTKESLSDILGFQSTSTIMKYLGILIKVSGSLTRDFNFIVNRMKQKLAGWKASLLSQVRRAVLVQSSLSTIPNYMLQCTHLPAKVLDSIDRVDKNFLWGSSKSSKKMHWIGWEKVTKPKGEGGLGLQTVKRRNISLLAKLNWRFQIERDSL